MVMANGKGTSAGAPGGEPDVFAKDGYAERFIRWKAGQLVTRVGFTVSDRGDIEQEMWLDLHRRLPWFDPGRASIRTFVRRVVEHRVSTLLRTRDGEARARGRMDSLHDVVPEADGEFVERWQTVDRESHLRRAGASDPDAPEARDLRIDLAAAVERLPEDLRDLALRLAHYTPTEAARSTGIPRNTLYKRRLRIRALFEKAGLAVYLPGGGADRRERG